MTILGSLSAMMVRSESRLTPSFSNSIDLESLFQ